MNVPEVMLSNATVAEVLRSATARLDGAGCDTPKLDAEILLAYALNKNRTWLYLYPKQSLQPTQYDIYARLIARREQREPVAYIVGHKEFFGLDFLVNQHVLIPRPETELLVETAIELTTHTKQRLSIADVCTGSGCIAITLAKYRPQANVFAGDISQQALAVARQNAARHQMSDRITFLNGDLLVPLTTPVNMIVSNPPYVSRPELAAPAAMPEVARYEPRLALDGGPAGLAIIERLLAEAKEKLNPYGMLLVEIGSEQGPAVLQLAQGQFPEATIQVKKDLAGLDRLLVVKKR